MKESFFKVEYHDCGLDYDYTICPIGDLEDHLNAVSEDVFYDEMYNPKITITVVRMKPKEFENWHKENVQP